MKFIIGFIVAIVVMSPSIINLDGVSVVAHVNEHGIKGTAMRIWSGK